MGLFNTSNIYIGIGPFKVKMWCEPTLEVFRWMVVNIFIYLYIYMFVWLHFFGIHLNMHSKQSSQLPPYVRLIPVLFASQSNCQSKTQISDGFSICREPSQTGWNIQDGFSFVLVVRPTNKGKQNPKHSGFGISSPWLFFKLCRLPRFHKLLESAFLGEDFYKISILDLSKSTQVLFNRHQPEGITFFVRLGNFKTLDPWKVT